MQLIYRLSCRFVSDYRWRKAAAAENRRFPDSAGGRFQATKPMRPAGGSGPP